MPLGSRYWAPWKMFPTRSRRLGRLLRSAFCACQHAHRRHQQPRPRKDRAQFRRHFGELPARPNAWVLDPSIHADILVREKTLEQVHFCLSYDGLPIRTRTAISAISNHPARGSMTRGCSRNPERYGLAYNIYSFRSSFEDCGNFSFTADAVRRILTGDRPLSQNIRDLAARKVSGANWSGSNPS